MLILSFSYRGKDLYLEGGRYCGVVFHDIRFCCDSGLFSSEWGWEWGKPQLKIAIKNKIKFTVLVT